MLHYFHFKSNSGDFFLQFYDSTLVNPENKINKNLTKGTKFRKSLVYEACNFFMRYNTVLMTDYINKLKSLSNVIDVVPVKSGSTTFTIGDTSQVWFYKIVFSYKGWENTSYTYQIPAFNTPRFDAVQDFPNLVKETNTDDSIINETPIIENNIITNTVEEIKNTEEIISDVNILAMSEGK